MARINISRTNEGLNWLRDFVIYIDGKKVGTIANGETKEFNISAGYHSIFTKIDWCGSPTLSVNMNELEIKRLIVGGFKNGQRIMATGLVVGILSNIAYLLFDLEYLFYLIIPFILILI